MGSGKTMRKQWFNLNQTDLYRHDGKRQMLRGENGKAWGEIQI
jgi:hypothetical protein